MKIVEPSVELLWITPNAEKMIELAGRTCYKSEDRITEESSKKFVDNICNVVKHHSVIEHACASFRIVCSRVCAQQITRHRIFSYSMESQRYCNYSKDKFDNEISVIKPMGLTQEQILLWESSCLNCENTYLKLLKSNCKSENARMVLNNSVSTSIVMTGNFRSWVNFLQLRMDVKSQDEIRAISKKIFILLNKNSSSIFSEEKFKFYE